MRTDPPVVGKYKLAAVSRKAMDWDGWDADCEQ